MRHIEYWDRQEAPKLPNEPSEAAVTSAAGAPERNGWIVNVGLHSDRRRRPPRPFLRLEEHALSEAKGQGQDSSPGKRAVPGALGRTSVHIETPIRLANKMPPLAESQRNVPKGVDEI